MAERIRQMMRRLFEPPPGERYCPYPSSIPTGGPYRLKRALDLVGAAVALVLSLVLWVLVALAIRIESRGPVFFAQWRVGRGGVPFLLFKFRSMVPEAESLKSGLLSRSDVKGAFKMKDDPRVTRVGRYLRKTKIDELPQLLNVLQGTMSLVGPRPTSLEEVRRVYDAQTCQKFLGASNPGMTGLTQLRETLQGKMDLEKQIECDVRYLEQQNLFLDLKIILLTVPAIFWARKST